jgi:hypothetical protein
MSNHKRCLAQPILTLALLVAFLIAAPISTWAAFIPEGQFETTTTLTGPSGTFSSPQSLTFTATVDVVSQPTQAKKIAAAPIPTGTVTFLDNGVNIPGCVNVTLVNRIATCTVTLGKGTHVITAVYSGSTFFVGSASGNSLTLMFTFNDPAEVPEADTLALFAGGASSVTLWLGWQWKKLKRRK